MKEAILKCYVVDDSSIQRLSLIKQLEMFSEVEIKGEFGSILELKNELANKPVDVIFIDIEMPYITAFEFLDDLTIKPPVIFTSKTEAHAYRAFDYQPIDYLLKPTNEKRVQRAVKRALEQLKQNRTEDSTYIFVKSNLKRRKIYLRDLIYLSALGDYIKLVTYNDEFVILSTMKSFISELPEEKFLRVHKSYIINLKKVVSYTTKFILMDDGTEIPLSRNKKQLLGEALDKLPKIKTTSK